METKDSSKTKIRILKAAEKLFAEKGFDGARVDDIAKRAGVNKALIYYYFKGKRDILEELFNSLIDNLMEMSFSSIGDKVNIESAEEMFQLTEMLYGFMEAKKDTIRIMMMESLKASQKKPPLFRFSEIAMSNEAEKMIETLKNQGFNVDNIDMDEALIADFFTGIMPLISFIIYRDKWSEYFHIDPEELKKKFLDVFLTTHLAYHKVQLERIK